MNDLVHWKIPIGEPFLFGEIIIQSFPQLRGTAIDHCSTYLTIASAVLCCVLLYIPLCFYFILYDYQIHRHGPHLYIPLCFYFISSTAIYTFDMVSFTFLSPLSPFSPWGPALHSIMLLLYPSWTNAEIICCITLHSIMLLLYLWGHRSHPGADPFTFHYASTLSRDADWL